MRNYCSRTGHVCTAVIKGGADIHFLDWPSLFMFGHRKTDGRTEEVLLRSMRVLRTVTVQYSVCSAE